jgi:hypothetical protein
LSNSTVLCHFLDPRRKWKWKRYSVAIVVIGSRRVHGIRNRTIAGSPLVVEPGKRLGKERK